MNICEHLTVTARLFPDKEAVVFEGQRYTFADLERLSQFAAQSLNQAGVVRGDRVAIWLPNVPAFIIWYYATLRIGAIAVSISTRLAAAEVAFAISDCQAKVLITLPESLDHMDVEIPDCIAKCIAAAESGDVGESDEVSASSSESATWIETEPDDAALILYTSGTTGFAKGATLSHMNVRSNVHAFNHLCNMQPTDRILLAVPLFHCFGQNALLNSALNVGATLVLQRKFDLGEAKQLIADQRVTQLYGVPMMFQLIHDSCEPSDLSSVNYCFSAAATLPIQTSRRWQEKFGMPIYEGYGLTETSPFASYNHRLKFQPGSIGMPIDSVEMKIVDTETGRTCPPGQLGEIAIRGPNVMIGYWNRPGDTEQAIRDGWFHSGDIGRNDNDGYFYIVDRVKDMIAVGGQKVYPAEVERILLDHPLVAEAAVVGHSDEVFGERVIAFVVTAEAVDQNDEMLANEIIQFAGGSLANYKIPRRIVFVDELPRNPSGKILKTQLREIDLQSLTRSSEMPSNESTTEPSMALAKNTVAPTLRKQLEQAHVNSRQDIANVFVQALVRAITGTDAPLDPETRFLDAGLDSLMIVEMSSQIQVEVGPESEIPATLVFDHPRIRDLGNFLMETLTPVESALPSSMAGAPENVSHSDSNLETEIANMTEQQALEELMKEFEA